MSLYIHTCPSPFLLKPYLDRTADPARVRGFDPRIQAMILYSSKSPLVFLRLRGSVVPKAVKWAFSCALLAEVYSVMIHHSGFPFLIIEKTTPSETIAWGMSTSILGFLVVFRANLSYSR